MPDSEFERQLAGVHWACPAEGEQGEVARVETALDGDHANRALHVGVDYADYAARRVVRARAHRAAQRSECAARAIGIEPHPAAEKILGDEATGDEVGVGDGRLGAAPIAGRSRICARTLRPDLE